jgi:hypothetical protein
MVDLRPGIPSGQSALVVVGDLETILHPAANQGAHANRDQE